MDQTLHPHFSAKASHSGNNDTIFKPYKRTDKSNYGCHKQNELLELMANNAEVVAEIFNNQSDYIKYTWEIVFARSYKK